MTWVKMVGEELKKKGKNQGISESFRLYGNQSIAEKKQKTYQINDSIVNH